ncbi:MAG: alcohol dehydrogenase catalytic domain-containing protein [Streptosporangiales bacterium]|nr:alcohol dehydrogenase catalytic domain-containing protein [Streptosporangiales bacterium]
MNNVNLLVLADPSIPGFFAAQWSVLRRDPTITGNIDGGGEMRAIVTRSAGSMELTDVPEPRELASGEVLVRPEAVGVCGSDYHFLTGELVTPEAFGPQYPRIQGHEVAGTIEALGPDCPAGLDVGVRVAVWPLSSCGTCYACRIGRRNACPNFRLVGVHVDGALQERFPVPASQVFPVGDLEPQVAAFCEPTSIAVQAADRGRIAAGEPVAVLGAGPIGQAVALVAGERGAKVLMTDLVAGRLALGRAAGAETLDLSEHEDVVPLVREWAGGEGPPVVIDCTGEPAAIRSAVEMISPAGRVVVVGISHKELSLNVSWFTEKEPDILGSTVCGAAQFAEAVRVVQRKQAVVRRLLTHERPLEQAPDAIAHAMSHPAEVMKLIIRTG